MQTPLQVFQIYLLQQRGNRDGDQRTKNISKSVDLFLQDVKAQPN